MKMRKCQEYKKDGQIGRRNQILQIFLPLKEVEKGSERRFQKNDETWSEDKKPQRIKINCQRNQIISDQNGILKRAQPRMGENQVNGQQKDSLWQQPLTEIVTNIKWKRTEQNQNLGKHC